MDPSVDTMAPEPMDVLSYDSNVPYEEQLPIPTADAGSLASRIGQTKVYLLSESSGNRAAKRKHDETEAVEEDQDMEEDMVYRGNAILMQGTPISHLPTTGLFAFATHFHAQPLALEWINDNTCIFVFETKAAAKVGYQSLQKSSGDVPDEDEFVTAKPIPVACWPAEERIKNSLDQGEGLKGVLRMRWAKHDDVKRKGARKESEFYRKHGSTAGKVFDGRTDLPPKRRRRDDHDANDAFERAKLDEDLDNIRAQSDGEPEEPSSPHSKMRSDYIGSDGRTLLERTSPLRLHADLESRLTAPLPRRRRKPRMDQFEDRLHSPERDGMNETGRRREKTHGGKRNARPRQKTQQELDDELEAFRKEGH